MSERNPSSVLLAGFALKKSLDNGTKQYKATEVLGDRIESQNRELKLQTELQEEKNQIEEAKANLDRDRNNIMSLQLSEAEEQSKQLKISNAIAREELRLNKNQDQRNELRIRIKENEKDIEERQRDCVFHLQKEVERISGSWDTKVEKFLQITNHLATINQFGISTELASSFEDKKIIDSTLSDLNSNHKQIISQLNAEEVEDIFSIMKIFQVNEDRLLIDATFNLRIISKDLRALEKKDINLSANIEELKKSVLSLEPQLLAHNLEKPS